MGIQQYLWLSMIVLRASFCRTHNITLVPIPRPITWDNLWQCFKREMPDGTLRTIEGQEYYLEFRQYIKNKNSSMHEYVRDKILGYYGDSQFPIFFIKEMEFAGQKTNLYVTGQKSYLDDYMVEPKRFKFKDGGLGPKMQFIILAKNNFPYDLEEGIAHWVIWSNRGLTTEIIEEILQETILPTIEWKIYENAPNLKSVPEIAHKQIFLRRRPEKREQL